MWAYLKGVTLDFSRPGKSNDNAFVECFNGKFRDDCLNANRFLTFARRVQNATLGLKTITRYEHTVPRQQNARWSFIGGGITGQTFTRGSENFPGGVVPTTRACTMALSTLALV